MRYVFDEKIGITYNASSKARDDVARFVNTYVSNDGDTYKIIGKNDKSKTNRKYQKAFLAIVSLMSVMMKLGKEDILFVQSSKKLLKYIDWIKKIKRFKVIYLIHDLDALRDNYDNETVMSKMISELNKQEVLICHNNAMIRELKRRGCLAHMISLDIFDYYLEQPKKESNIHNFASISFAGNLSPNKTGFLYELDKSAPPYKVYIYGKKECEFVNLQYSGCFPAEELPQVLKGGFGLIWEGQKDRYDESTHPYIMFNNPHKASLYVVSGLPIIIWEKAAMAELVKKYHIGFTISDLSEINEKIFAISESEYCGMLENLRVLGNELTQGVHIHKALRQAEEYLLGIR